MTQTLRRGWVPVPMHGALARDWRTGRTLAVALSAGLVRTFHVCVGKSVSCSCVFSSSNLGNKSFNLESMKCIIICGSILLLLLTNGSECSMIEAFC